MRDVGNGLHLIANERIGRAFLVGGGSAEAAENDGTHFEGSFAQVGDLHVHFERAHAPGLVFADDEFQVIAAGSEDEAGVVLHVFAADLARAVDGELHRVAQVADGEFVALEDLAEDVNGGVVFVFFGDERNLRAGDDQGNGKVIMRIVLAEIRSTGIERHVHLGELRCQFVLELLLAVGLVQMLEVAVGVIPGAVFELEVGTVRHDLQMAVSTVFEGIVADEAQDVIRRSVLLHLGKDAAEIVRIEEGFSAGVGRKRREGFLRRGVVVQVVQPE